MGFPMHPALTRAALIAVMLGGGLLYAGISQAQDSDVQVERGSELVAASGGPASAAHLIAFARDAAAVDVRDDDVDADAPTGARAQPAAAAATPAGASVSGDATASPADATQLAAIHPSVGDRN